MPTAATILLYLVAVFLTVATLWPVFWYSTQTISPEEDDPRWPLTIAVIPFVILIYFGSAFIISDTIELEAASLTTMEQELPFSEGLVVILTYVALSGWLWLRWHPITPDKQKTRGN